MAKGYWIAAVDVQNPDAYKNYVSANGVAFAKFGGRFLVRGGPRREVVEGKSRARNVIIEFPSYEAALACWNSPDYKSEGKAGKRRRRRHRGDRRLRGAAAGGE